MEINNDLQCDILFEELSDEDLITVVGGTGSATGGVVGQETSQVLKTYSDVGQDVLSQSKPSVSSIATNSVDKKVNCTGL